MYKRNCRVMSIILAAAMIFMTAGCGKSIDSETKAETSQTSETAAAAETKAEAVSENEESGETWTFDRRVEILVPTSEGSSTDQSFRAFMKYLEEELDATISITNVAGAAGVVGYTWANTQDSTDGDFFQYTAPSVLGSAISGNFDFDFNSKVKPLAGLLSCNNIIFTNSKTPYKTWDELKAYAEENPGKVSMAVGSTVGIDGAVTGQFLSSCGLDLNLISFAGESMVSCISGQVDLLMNSYAESAVYIESGDLIPILVINDKRDDRLPDIPCTVEEGVDATLGPWYGFTYMEGTPEAAQKAFAEAVLRASRNEEWIQWMKDNSFETDFVCGTEEFQAIWDNTSDVMEDALAFFSSAEIN